MSGTKRHPIARRSQNPLITDEALRLFVELEGVPKRKRDSRTFKNAEHQLARMLNLVGEYWSMCSVLDRSERPAWPDHLQAFQDWHKVRRVREELLKACKLQAAE
jgi:hypothetical protein